ncbi:(2Fe-2S)-binding protein [Streptomyces spirodelae]|uniref:(2Fe-2S)-binding protein n=1 Tax=Streptomyces spirodelae TaxID=2812904 RepID=A0ABS3X2Z4_9ACTN|nr:(2Fe-2S)-binding protein [Streptomyces spirodelae]
MSPRLVPAGSDSTGRRDRPLRITVDGEPADGIEGQTLAGVLLASGRTAWRTGPSGAGRGVFCGIGVCFDCLVTVNEDRDVRACRRRAVDGDVVRSQSRAHPGRTDPRPGPQPGPDPGPDHGHDPDHGYGHGSGPGHDSRSGARAEGEK